MRNANVDDIEPITVAEMKVAEMELLKFIQRECYQDELASLTTSGMVKKSSSLHKLDHIMINDELRVGGRLQRSTIPDESKHQLILPRNHHVTDLIIRYYHQISGHSGREYVLSLLRSRYWIIHGNKAVRRILGSCVDCHKRQRAPGQQKMAELPKDRVTPGKPPFTYVGVDFFGHFYVKRGRYDLKRYGCIFTCLSIRAIHIEVTQSMNTESFLNALRRFIARRGRPSVIRSDNGSNIVGANKEIRSAIREWNQQKIHESLLQEDIQWVFNPPSGSHHGGVWERCIRTVRKVLMSLLKGQTVDDEALTTFMCEVEAIVNGRPITTVSDDHNDSEPLTPNHLLLLRSGADLPLGHFTKTDLYVRKRWRRVQYLVDQFWIRWVREYLPLLQIRSKWITPQRNFEVDDVVLIVDEQSPRNLWPMARVTEVYPNKDGLIRRVQVQTKNRILDRPIDKCILLKAVNEAECT